MQEKLDALARRQEQLEREHQALREQKKRDDATIERLEKENQELRRRLDKFIRLYFGRTKSEAISPDQLELVLQGLGNVLTQTPQPAPPVEKAPRNVGPRQPRRALDDSRLEQRETVIEPEDVKADPEGWTKLGEERTTQLDYEPGRLFRHVIIRPRYVRKEQFAIAPLPAQPIDKGMVGAGLLAWLLMSKYTDHRVPRVTDRTMKCCLLRNCMTDEGSKAPRDRLTGAGLKSPLAALVKSHGRERRRKRPGHYGLGQMGGGEMNASEPLMTCRNVSRARSKPGGSGCPGTQRGRCLFSDRVASGIKVA